MKKFLILALMLFAFYGCAEKSLTTMCEKESNVEACQTYYVKARVKCNDYDPSGCHSLAYIHQHNLYEDDIDKYNFYVKNISEKELYKNYLMYQVKACMLGDQVICQYLEKWKIELENDSRNNP